MTKLLTLLTVILMLGNVSVLSQPLQNTYWIMYYPTGTFFCYFNFGIDTAFVSTDSINYTPVSTVQVNGNLLTIEDIPGTGCPPEDTGRYTYLIQNDTLKLTLISDPCVSRMTTMTTFILVRLYTGIPDVDLLPPFQLFPNPSEGRFSLALNSKKPAGITIYNMTGEIIHTAFLYPGITEIDLRNMPKGIYLVKATSGNGTVTKKILIE